MKTTAEIEDEAKRLDKFVADLGFARKKTREWGIKVNGEVKKPSYRLREGDVIEFEPKEDEIFEILPEATALDVIWEDENAAVVNKPSGMLTHPTQKETSNTLVNALLYRYGNNLSDINGEFRRGIVHRLDRNTSGLILIAKNNAAHEDLAAQIKNRTVVKKYAAIVNGVIEANEGKIELPIGRNPKSPEKMMIIPSGKESLTEYKVLERFPQATYLELTLHTGRTHQIRVHMKAIHHPVFNDTLYGAGIGKVKTQEQVLQSYFLRFTKPLSDEIIELKIEPDEKIKKVLTYLRSKK